MSGMEAMTVNGDEHRGDLWCAEDGRRQLTRAAGWNGIDYVEVSEDQGRLDIYLLGHAPAGLAVGNVRLEGGRRIQHIEVTAVQVQRSEDPRHDDCIAVFVDRPGDFSTYRLCLVEADERGRPTEEPLAGFDPRYACVNVSFKAGCPSDLDCAPVDDCPAIDRVDPDIDYLARDYQRLRRLIFDRLALLVPDWRERHVPDVGVTLVELLAYVGDRLSYYQDAVATEAYVDTARKRVSVKRHARLVDYHLHEGCNARAWVCLSVVEEIALDLGAIAFVASNQGASDTPMSWDRFRELSPGSRQVFEPVATGTFMARPAHNRIRFYTWGDLECCLVAGATTATLVDEWVEPAGDTYNSLQQTAANHSPKPVDTPDRPDDSDDEPNDDDEPVRRLGLRPGDILVFEEVIGPRTAVPADADPSHRHAVCLTRVEPMIDPVTGQPVVDIGWAESDALPFALCLSSREPAPDCEPLSDVSIACGNVVLVDHGLTVGSDVDTVPVESSEETCGDGCHPPGVVLTPGRYRPPLDQAPVTHSVLVKPCPASGAIHQDPRHAQPNVTAWQVLADSDLDPGPGVGVVWTAVQDLLGSHGDDRHFVVDVDEAGQAVLRFGDGDAGRLPEARSHFFATYRVGNGPAGNVGAEAINQIVTKDHPLDGVSIGVRNPLPARGGTAPETVDQARLLAPHAFRQELARAVTPADYAAIVERDFAEVQRANASARFTGSHTEILVSVDQLGVDTADQALLDRIALHLDRYRRIGHDVVVAPAVQVAIDLSVIVCVDPTFLSAPVEAAVRAALGARRNPDGSIGFFHPDRRSFGDDVAISDIVAVVQRIAGVDSVVVRALNRLWEPPMGEIEAGVLELGPREVARLDNDRSLPENGVLRLDMRGGR